MLYVWENKKQHKSSQDKKIEPHGNCTIEIHKIHQILTQLRFKISRCVGTPGQTLPQPSEVPAPTLPHVQKLTRDPQTAWIRAWDVSGSTAPSPYNSYGLIPKWAGGKKQRQHSFIRSQPRQSSKRGPIDFQGFLSITNLTVAAYHCCQEASRTLGSSQLSTRPAAPSLASIWLGQSTNHLEGQGIKQSKALLTWENWLKQ